MKGLVVLAAAVAMVSTPAWSADYAWPVMRVVDGDTVAVDASADLPPELADLKVRLLGVDTPEKGGRAKCADERDAGQAATTFTEGAIAEASAIVVRDPRGANGAAGSLPTSCSTPLTLLLLDCYGLWTGLRRREARELVSSDREPELAARRAFARPRTNALLDLVPRLRHDLPAAGRLASVEAPQQTGADRRREGAMEGHAVTNLSLEQMDVETTLHAFTPIHEHEKTGPHIITGGDGIYVTDNKGDTYIDAMASLFCVNAGYGRKEIGDAIADQGPQLPLLPHHGGPCQRAADQAERQAHGPAARIR